ncbi:MAG: class I SAM-dependent methyltransferase [Bdellovibrionota bacterium]
MRSNDYSDLWFATFLAPISPVQTAAEAQFVARQLPLATHPELLDLCCGSGRHSIALARMGYGVTGVDHNEKAIREAEKNAGSLNATFIHGDIRTFELLRVNGILVLWQSFGFYSPMENRRLLEKWRGLLHPGGRLVLDVYNRAFFEGKDGERIAKTPRGEIIETRRLRGSQLSVRLTYPSRESDHFQWEIFDEPGLVKLAEECGFSLRIACRSFDEALPPSPLEQRMQLVFERKE